MTGISPRMTPLIMVNKNEENRAVKLNNTPTYVSNGKIYCDLAETKIIIGSLDNHDVKILSYSNSFHAKLAFDSIRHLFCFETLEEPEEGKNMVNF